MSHVTHRVEEQTPLDRYGRCITEAFDAMSFPVDPRRYNMLHCWGVFHGHHDEAWEQPDNVYHPNRESRKAWHDFSSDMKRFRLRRAWEEVFGPTAPRLRSPKQSVTREMRKEKVYKLYGDALIRALRKLGFTDVPISMTLSAAGKWMARERASRFGGMATLESDERAAFEQFTRDSQAQQQAST